MKLPEKPPSLEKNIDLRSLFDLLNEKNIWNLIQKANSEYVYWDTFKYWKLPEGISPEIAWTALKVSRRWENKHVPLYDLNDIPFSYNLTGKTQELLHTIDRNFPILSNLDEEGSRPFHEHFRIDSLMEEAITSSMIEGAVTTISEAKAMLSSGRKPKNEAEQMVLNNYRAIQEIKKLKNQPLSLEILHHIHRIMTEKAMAKSEASGRFRTDDESKNFYVMDESDGTIAYTPPLASKIPDRIQKMIYFANNEEKDRHFIHPVIKAIILHFWMSYEHPYLDGNGRTARSLFYWYLLKKNYPVFEYISISKILLQAPAQYYRSFLYTEYDDNDLTYFIHYNLQAIHKASEELRKFIEEKKEEYFDSINLLSQHLYLNHRQKMLLQDCLKNPKKIYSIREHQRHWFVAYQTARMDLLRLFAKGFLEKIKEKKQFFFRPVKDLKEKLTGKSNSQ